MRITDITAAVIRADTPPDASRSDPAQDPIILRITTDEGVFGLAEYNQAPEAMLGLLASPPSSTHERGVGSYLLGADPEDRERLLQEIYIANWHSMRRGLGLSLLHALDVALADIQARTRGVPLWKFLYGDDAQAPRPYLTVYTGEGSFDQTAGLQRDMIAAAHELGYGGVKVEPLPECCPPTRVADLVREGRDAAGDLAMLVDFGYRFLDPHEAIEQITAIARYAPLLVETPMWTDDLDGYRTITEMVDVPIAGAEIIESEWELHALVEHGGIHVVQPWPNRVGIAGSVRVIERAAQQGCSAMLGGWNATSIGNAATLHVAAGVRTETFALEHAPDGLYPRLSAHIASPLPELVDGRLPLPSEPGLSVELDEDVWSFALAHAPHVAISEGSGVV